MLPGTVVRTAKENLEERQRIQVNLFDLNEERHKILQNPRAVVILRSLLRQRY